MLRVADAVAAVAANARLLPTESVALDAANGRVLRETICAEREQPPFDRVMMDGIALNANATPQAALRCLGTVFAGDEPRLSLPDAASCLEVMTGAVLPAGADCVVPVEQLSRDGQMVTVAADAVVEAGRFVHAAGSDHAQGATLLEPGSRIGMTETAVIASAGYATFLASRLAKVTVIATGDELVPAGAAVDAHQIRLSNGPALVSAALSTGLATARHLHCPDSQDQLTAVLSESLAGDDIVILSGGVSRGKADYVPDVLANLGVEKVFHRVAQKPGKPLWFGRTATSTVFGLPGNPVSTLVTFQRYVAPFLAACAGLAPPPPPQVVVAEPVTRLAQLSRFVPVTLQNRDGTVLATPVAFNTSGDFAALARTAGIIEVAPGDDTMASGTPCAFFGWRPANLD
ncbi:MAG: molybdopterin molybdotransferase MoeA [Pseudomonadota bacterium]